MTVLTPAWVCAVGETWRRPGENPAAPGVQGVVRPGASPDSAARRRRSQLPGKGRRGREKILSQTGEGTETELEKAPEVLNHEDQDLRHILAVMQQSLTQIEGKIDSLSYRMDRMSERLDKQSERLDQAERRVSAVEDGQIALATRQLKLVQEHRDTADVRTLGHIRTKVQEFQETAVSEVRHMGKYAVARVYGEGDRPGRVLENLIRPRRSTNLIIKAVAVDGSIVGDPESVAARFREYYQTLYTTRGGPDPNAIRDYLTHIVLPKLSDNDREALGAPFTLGEIAKALGCMAEEEAGSGRLETFRVNLARKLTIL
ncbi:hypothetical protein NDU88_005278 [Pleurodeles waltl]|uniref:Uncharacterized protein n=1 Tax=Pleurodeles waltl TaxID=8319 RepID=A0AAV7RND1_PLEWA|nr:hypothetical protein NDU88_005278 [Pleurodeles waltl]